MKPLPELDAAQKEALVEHCRAFILKQEIHCVETIYQTDRVIENAYEFVEGVCNIVGYTGYDDED